MRGECAHCLLPLGRRPAAGVLDGERVECCCYGCLLALQVTRARGESGAAASILIRLGLAIFFGMNVMMVSLPTYVPYLYGAGVPGNGPLFQVLHLLALIFAGLVLVLLGWPILAGAVQGIRSGGANTDALIVIGTAAAYGLSVRNTVTGHGAVYFDTAAMLLVLVTLGRYLEAHAKAEAGAAVRASLAAEPPVAIRLCNGTVEPVAPNILMPGDVIRVGAGDAFATDGVVLDGIGGVDEAALTGESRPVLKQPGATVAGGTCSIDGLFRVRVTAPVATSAAARIAALLAAARRERAPVERVADRLAAVLVPAVVCVAVTAALLWTRRAGIEQGVLVALAVLVVACPCALGIATPIAVWTGLATAARRGVIVRTAGILERTADIDHVVFDKTGTLTSRTPRLMAIEPAGRAACAEDILSTAAALEMGINHPLARAILGAWKERGTAVPHLEATRVRLVPGRGVCGEINDQQVAVGTVGFGMEVVSAAGVPIIADSALMPPSMNGDGSHVAVSRNGQLLGILRFAETARSDAAAAISTLRRRGKRISLLSGDQAAGAVVPTLIAEAEAATGLLPADKVLRIRAARRDARRSRSAVAMVGDGINDAPALAAADVGIAVGSATDLARINADVAVVSDDLGRIPWLIEYAGRVMRVVRQNLFWACAYNAVALAAAAAGKLNPLIASLAMLASSLAVVANARRLRHG